MFSKDLVVVCICTSGVLLLTCLCVLHTVQFSGVHRENSRFVPILYGYRLSLEWS